MEYSNSHLKPKQFLVYSLNNIKYAIDVNNINGILDNNMKITKIPLNDKFVVGIIPYQNTSITVFDIKKKLYNEFNTDKNIIVVICVNNVFYGIIVDKVLELFEIEETSIKKVVFLKQSITNSFITNQFKFKDDFAFVVDPMILNN